MEPPARLRGEALEQENGSLRHELDAARRAVAELNALLETSAARANALVLESELSSLVLEEIFNSSRDAIWVVDRDCRIVRVNARMAALAGGERSSLIGRRCSDLLHLPCCGTAECAMTRVLEGGSQVVLADVETEFAAGKMTCILSATPCRDPCAEVFGVVETFTDITARKEAEQALQRANEELERLSRTDGLTGLANRRCFNDVLEAEWRRAIRERRVVSLLMADVDFFKRYNDTYGHQAGDRCLAAVAQAIRSVPRRSTDLAARYGGEEFAVILPGTDASGAHQVAELIRREVERLGLPHAASSAGDHVTLSVGVASLVPREPGSSHDLVRRADEALYGAKAEGRNRTVLHGDLPAAGPPPPPPA